MSLSKIASEIPRELPEQSAVLLFLRRASGWSSERLAAALHLTAATLRRQEAGGDGTEVPSWPLLFQAATLTHGRLGALHEARAWLHEVRRGTGPLEAALRRDPEMARTSAWLVAEALRRGDLRRRQPAPVPTLVRVDDEDAAALRERARELWELFGQQSPLEWAALPGPHDELRSWAVVERLCLESARKVARFEESPVRDSLSDWLPDEVAHLACRLALLVSPEDPRRHRICQHAWAHVGNVRRVFGRLAEAEEAFYYAEEHLLEGRGVDPSPLDAARPFFLQALLCRDQGRPEDALALLREAGSLARPDDPAVPALRAEILFRQEDPEGAAAALAPVLACSIETPEQRFEARRAIRLAFELAVWRWERGDVGAGAELLGGFVPLLEASKIARDSIVIVKLFLKLAASGRLEAERARSMLGEFLAINQAARAPRRR